MKLAFHLLAAVILGGALAAVFGRKLVHCALWLTVAFAGLASIYLQLGAEFIGFAQIMVYIGAVAILLVFAILLTQNAGMTPEVRWAKHSGLVGGAIAALVLGCLLIGLGFSPTLRSLPPPAPASSATVQQIGEQLMTRQIVPLEVLGLLLTAAMIGAVVIALGERRKE